MGMQGHQKVAQGLGVRQGLFVQIPAPPLGVPEHALPCCGPRTLCYDMGGWGVLVRFLLSWSGSEVSSGEEFDFTGSALAQLQEPAVGERRASPHGWGVILSGGTGQTDRVPPASPHSEARTTPFL